MPTSVFESQPSDTAGRWGLPGVTELTLCVQGWRHRRPITCLWERSCLTPYGGTVHIQGQEHPKEQRGRHSAVRGRAQHWHMDTVRHDRLLQAEQLLLKLKAAHTRECFAAHPGTPAGTSPPIRLQQQKKTNRSPGINAELKKLKGKHKGQQILPGFRKGTPHPAPLPPSFQPDEARLPLK